MPVQTQAEPLTQETCPLPFALPETPGEYAVTVSFRLREDADYAAAGYEVAFGQGVFRIGELRETAGSGCGELQVIRGTFNLGVRGEHFDAQFAFLNGMGLKSYRFGGREMIELPPRPNFWRAPVDNDRGSNMMGRLGIWKLASLYASDFPAEGASVLPESERNAYPRCREEGKGADKTFSVTQRIFLPTVPETSMELTMRFHSDGTVDYVMDYDPGKIHSCRTFRNSACSLP